MKNFFIILFSLILLFDCRKKDEQEYKDVYGEIIYTDSFTSEYWELPLSRKKIEAHDKDIGKTISEDVIEPRLRKIYKLIEALAVNIKNNNKKELESKLTASAFNSFSLRFPSITFNNDYKLRVGYPVTLEEFKMQTETKVNVDDATADVKVNNENNGNKENLILNNLKNIQNKKENDDKDETVKDEDKTIVLTENGIYWVKFKIMFLSKSIISKVMVEPVNDDYKISDFDNNFFIDFTNIFKTEDKNE